MWKSGENNNVYNGPLPREPCTPSSGRLEANAADGSDGPTDTLKSEDVNARADSGPRANEYFGGGNVMTNWKPDRNDNGPLVRGQPWTVVKCAGNNDATSTPAGCKGYNRAPAATSHEHQVGCHQKHRCHPKLQPKSQPKSQPKMQPLWTVGIGCRGVAVTKRPYDNNNNNHYNDPVLRQEHSPSVDYLTCYPVAHARHSANGRASSSDSEGYYEEDHDGSARMRGQPVVEYRQTYNSDDLDEDEEWNTNGYSVVIVVRSK